MRLERSSPILGTDSWYRFWASCDGTQRTPSRAPWTVSCRRFHADGFVLTVCADGFVPTAAAPRAARLLVLSALVSTSASFCARLVLVALLVAARVTTLAARVTTRRPPASASEIDIVLVVKTQVPTRVNPGGPRPLDVRSTSSAPSTPPRHSVTLAAPTSSSASGVATSGVRGCSSTSTWTGPSV
mmetsp:Transcript_11698/g.31131  ORF Transcript_11698/g.31131 Transcript_11698/m.31131 type:complete len:186 (-) Transcript_11698:416-973(-)